MKLKSYLRGIGAGMIVAALVMGASMPKTTASPEIINNETLKESVKKDNDTSLNEDKTGALVSADLEKESESDLLPKDENLPVNENLSDEKDTSDTEGTLIEEGGLNSDTENTEDIKTPEVSENDIKETETDKPVEEVKPEEPKNEEPKKEEPKTEGPKTELTGETFTLKVISGDDSVSVSRRLYEAGLIESVSSFDDYLCEHRYDRFIGVGFYDIPVGADYDTMARIITRRYYGE